jgi:hypothetical protein
MPIRRLVASSLAMVLALTAVVSPTTAHAPDPFFASGPFGQNQVLQYRWRGGAEPSSVIKTAISAAATDANASRASKAATFAYNASGSNPIGYGIGATCGVNGLACFTRNVPYGFTIWLREQGHVYDWGTLKWCQAYSSPPNGCYDAETITLDELGHVEGLDHHVNYADNSDYLDAVVQTYSRTKPYAGWNAHAFGRCDIATLQMFYDMLNTSAKYSTCLDLTTVLTLTASASVVVPGGTAGLTATLKVYDADSYRLLGGNLVSARTVTLQRRAPGATTWTTVGTMPGGSAAGTYVLNQQVWADTEYRAVFSTPTTEGINGDSSPTIRVSVSSCTAAVIGIRPDAPCA